MNMYCMHSSPNFHQPQQDMLFPVLVHVLCSVQLSHATHAISCPE